MKPKDLFDIIARAIGLVVVLYGLGHLLYGVIGAMGMLDTKYERYNAVAGIVQLIAGMLIMRGVIPVADIAFPPKNRQEETEDDLQRGAKKETHLT